MSRPGEVVHGRGLAASASPAAPATRLIRAWLGLFALSETEAQFSTRGFTAGDPGQRVHLETIGATFVAGYNTGLIRAEPRVLRGALQSTPPARRGFLVEGAAMGTAVADAVAPGRRRLPGFMAAYQAEYGYLLHVGIGWALARMPWRRRAIGPLLDPVHHWLVHDGTGFHDAYFHCRRLDRGWRRIRGGYPARAYHQGIGRGFWFTSGGDVRAAALAIARCDPASHGDLWSGLGLAIAYTGGPAPVGAAALAASAGRYRRDLMQGAAFALEAQRRAGPPLGHTARLVEALTHRSASAVVAIVRRARARLPESEPESGDMESPRYETWRRRVRDILTEGVGRQS